MISIKSPRGNYTFDEGTKRTYKDNIYVPSTVIEPVYSGNGKDSEPIFAGLYLVGSNEIITVNGNVKPISDINSIK